ncbi:hypothetical protein ACSNN9_21075 [Micromonospora sp. URMC 107]|uniref:hypothetical protein n=1 Tax=Micromonospora sp. URMC 107 TaxID=3423418 RepID=UPI003F1D219B
MPRRRTAPPRQTQAKGARIVSAYLENADVFRTAKGGKPKGPAVLVLRNRKDFVRKDFDRKAADLVRLGQEGKLVKTKPKRRQVEHRDPEKPGTRKLTTVYRDRVIRQLNKGQNYMSNKELVQSLYRGKKPDKYPVTGPGVTLDPDHVHELQLGGEDSYDNLRLMDAWTNREIGREIGQALKDVPEGTPVIVKVIP